MHNRTISTAADQKIPLIGFCAFSGTGKTTLLKKLIPILRQRGIRLAVIKHSHHDFEIDHPGKDSYELRKAGANQLLIASQHRIVHITELEERADAPPPKELIGQLDLSTVDIVLVEGYRHEAFPKIELHRPALKKPLIFPDDDSVIAIASDEPIAPGDRAIPRLDLNNVSMIAEFIEHQIIQPKGGH